MEQQLNPLEAGIVDDEDLRVIYQESLRQSAQGITGFRGMEEIPCLRNGLLVRIPTDHATKQDAESHLELVQLASDREGQRIEAMKGVLEAITPFMNNGRGIGEALQVVFHGAGE